MQLRSCTLQVKALLAHAERSNLPFKILRSNSREDLCIIPCSLNGILGRPLPCSTFYRVKSRIRESPVDVRDLDVLHG
jgi:hypothetical protein